MIMNSSLILFTISSYLGIHQIQLLQHDRELLPDPLHHLHPTSGSIQSSSSSMILNSSLILSTISSYLRIHPVQLLHLDLVLLPDLPISSSYQMIHPVQLLKHDLGLLPDPLHHLILPDDPSSPAPPVLFPDPLDHLILP
jgi:hypothetical protein